MPLSFVIIKASENPEKSLQVTRLNKWPSGGKYLKTFVGERSFFTAPTNASLKQQDGSFKAAFLSAPILQKANI